LPHRLIADFDFQKRCQLFIPAPNESLSIVAVRINDPDRSPVGINCSNAAPTPTGFAEFVGNSFPVLHHAA
jgi:hypothetical protein